MSDTVLKVENLSKQYRLGLVSSGTLRDDLTRWWAKVRGKEDPLLKIGEHNQLDTVEGEYVWALRNLSFEVKQGEVLGIVGKNGAGKSTLLKILSKVTGPTSGNIKIKGRVASLLEVGTGFHPELTGKENIFLNGAILGMNKREIRSKLDEIIDFAGVAKYVDTPVKRYSSGMYVRLAFAVAAHLDPEILIVDEVLAVGDVEFQQKAIGKMQDVSTGEGRTVLFVSHNMKSVKSLCTRAVLLEKGKVKMSGSADEVVATYLNLGVQSDFGKIPEHHPRNKYYEGVANFNDIVLHNKFNTQSDFFNYQEPIKVICTLEVTQKLEQGVFVFIFGNHAGDMYTYSGSNDHNASEESVTLDPGTYKITCVVHQKLLPGNYSLNVGIMKTDGYAYDFVKSFGNLVIEKFGDNKLFYPWGNNLGFTNVPSSIQIDKTS